MVCGRRWEISESNNEIKREECYHAVKSFLNEYEEKGYGSYEADGSNLEEANKTVKVVLGFVPDEPPEDPGTVASRRVAGRVRPLSPNPLPLVTRLASHPPMSIRIHQVFLTEGRRTLATPTHP